MTLYELTILVSAFLVFQVQPVIAKIILPWFGGSAAVWTTCLLFFQMTLLLCYLYAHALIRYVKLPRVQALIHISFLLASVLALPIYPGAGWKPLSADDPTWRILILLVATVGVPYGLLSSTGPLLQAWYARRYKDRPPYRLYALSNAGSMLALISYPVLFEPVLTTNQQAWMWSGAYGLFIVLCGFAAIRSATSFPMEPAAEWERPVRPGLRLYLMWLGLPACASVLLLAATNHLSQNVAPIPFLWVLPLSIYLLTFILCFQGNSRYRRHPYLELLAMALSSMALVLGIDMQGSVPVKIMVPLFAIGLYACCMACHGELACIKPHPRYLTQFYLTVSAGGALGGILVALVAPRVFNGYYEMPLGLVACGAFVVLALRQDKELIWFKSWRQPAPLVSLALLAGMAVYLGFQVHHSATGARVRVRDFYGALNVRDSRPMASSGLIRVLTHGTINHGEQYLDPARRDTPISYYGPSTGIALAIRQKQKTGTIRVGVVGLGTGTLAAYGRAGDYYRFYEINPLVVRIAESEFFFLKDSKADVQVAIGDARLSPA